MSDAISDSPEPTEPGSGSDVPRQAEGTSIDQSAAVPTDVAAIDEGEDGRIGAGASGGHRQSATRASLAPSLALAAAVTTLDQLTKHWAVNRLSGGRIIDIVGSLRFELTFNRGMAFSRGTGLGPVIGVAALIVVTVLLVSMRRAGSRLSLVATGMVIGGAIGNILDRLFRGDGWFHGAVVDFINPQFWPVFNVADIGVSVGGALIILGAVLESRGAGAGRATNR